MGLVEKIKKWKEERSFRRFSRENEWEGLIPGDVVKYKSQRFLYAGINKHGGPGHPWPEPTFYPVDSRYGPAVYYLRPRTKPDPIFGEDITPATGNESSIRFLNAGPGSFEKVGHMTPEEWKAAGQEAQRELTGRRPN